MPISSQAYKKWTLIQQYLFFRQKQSLLFGLPFELFSDGEIQENPRFQRRVPSSTRTRSTSINPYLTSSGVPLYKYRQKYPQGYSGRKRRNAPR